MAGEHGIKNIVILFDLIIESGNVAEKMVIDKAGWGSRLSKLLSLTDELFALKDLNIDELKLEFKDIDDGDFSDLYAHFKSKFDISNDVVEAIVEEGFGLLKSAGDLTVSIIKFVKKIKAAKTASSEVTPA